MNDFASGQIKTYTECQSQLQNLSFRARNEVRQLAETFWRQLQAAAGGDDYQERSAAAWRTYQHGYYDLSMEFQKDYQECVNTYMKSAEELQLEATRASIHDAMERLRSMERQLSPEVGESTSGGGGTVAKKKDSKSS